MKQGLSMTKDFNLSDVNFSGTVIKEGKFKNGLMVGGNFEKADLSFVVVEIFNLKPSS